MGDQALLVGQVDELGRVLVEETKSQQIFRCPCCNHLSSRYKVSFSTLHLQIARTIFLHCLRTRKHTFHKSDLSLSHTGYGNLCFLQRFGLIYYLKDDNGKKISGHWGVPVKRLAQFLRNEWKVAKFIWRDVDSKTQTISEERIFASEIPKFSHIIDQETMLPYFVEYEDNASWYESDISSQQ